MVRRKLKGKKLPAAKQKQVKTVVLIDKSKKSAVRKSHILQEMKTLQRSTRLLIPKAPFARLVREILIDLFPRYQDFRLQITALEALQEAAEMYLVQFFEDAVLLCLHQNRVTLMQRDMVLLRRLRGRNDIINR